jgi:transcriptional regulator ATRX
MEEKIYERQVTKQAISKRVLDEQQIDRHYHSNDIQELYSYNVDPAEPRPIPALPKDRLFADILKKFDLVYKYHEHDSLLENKEEETLDEEERKAAWDDYEYEKNKPPPTFNSGSYANYVLPQRSNGLSIIDSLKRFSTVFFFLFFNSARRSTSHIEFDIWYTI